MAARLEPDEAAEICDRAARAVTDALTKEGYSYARSRLTEGLVAAWRRA